MTQFTNVKYMEPSLDTKPNFDTKNTNTLPIPTIQNSGISQSQYSKLSNIPSTTQQPMASKSLFNKVNQKSTVKKEYLLPIIYKKIFGYFTNVFSANKPQHKDVNSMSDAELRVYVDQLLIRNQELKSYSKILDKWQTKFTRNVPVVNRPRTISISGLNKPFGSSLLNVANKPGMLNKPTLNSLKQPMSPMNKPGSMPNRPAYMMNKPGNMPNRPVNMMNKPMSKPIATKTVSASTSTAPKPIMQVKPINK